MVKGDFVPLNRLSDYTNRCIVNIELPLSVIKPEQILFNFKNADSLCDLVGLAVLTINGTNEGETSAFTPEISGINNNGEDTGTVKKTNVPTFKSNSSEIFNYDELALNGNKKFVGEI